MTNDTAPPVELPDPPMPAPRLDINMLKTCIALVGLVCVTVLMIAGRVSEVVGVGIIGPVMGYALGNGIAAATSAPVTPLFRRRGTGG